MDEILRQLNAAEVEYLPIGGMNFLLRHAPELTFDVDVWIRDTPENLERLNQPLRRLGGGWAPISEDWRWLEKQTVFCLTTEQGALDVFRDVRGLEGRYDECRRFATETRTATGVPFNSLSDRHMLVCQEVLARSHPVRRNRPMTDDPNLKRREEEKRDRAWDPVQRWRLIQETITWAEANLPPEKRRNRPRTHPANSTGGTTLAANPPTAKLNEHPAQSDRR